MHLTQPTFFLDNGEGLSLSYFEEHDSRGNVGHNVIASIEVIKTGCGGQYQYRQDGTQHGEFRNALFVEKWINK